MDPTGHPRIEDFSSILALGATLGPSWRQEGAQSAPRQLLNFVAFGVDLGRFFQDFRTYVNTTSRLISHSILLFLQHQSNNVSARGSNFQFRHGGGLARAAHWIHMLNFLVDDFY